MTTQLTIIIPTFNEFDNVRPMIESVRNVMQGVDWELIFVDDDSSDGTSELVRECAREDPRIRGIQRIRRRGLSSACVEGMLACSSPYLAVMDADGQHDERLLPEMLRVLQEGDDDVVVGSRYMEGGSTGEFKGVRLFISRVATSLSQLLLGTKLTDPMSGFFMLRRTFLDEVVRKIYGKGFKILLDLFASSKRPVRYRELPYTMRVRQLGESKLGFSVTLEFLMMLLYKLSGKLIPGRFIKFSSVGLVGVGVHLGALYVVHLVMGSGFVFANSVATLVAMTSNYLLNNVFTFRDQRLHGLDFWAGLLKFYVACSLGAVIGVSLAGYLHAGGMVWWLSGFIGAVAAAVWNFTTTSIFTWGGASIKRRGALSEPRA